MSEKPSPCPWCRAEPKSTLGSLGNLWVDCTTETCPLSRMPAMKVDEWNVFRPGSQGVVDDAMVERFRDTLMVLHDGPPTTQVSVTETSVREAIAALLAAMGGKDHRIWTKEDQRWDDYVRACYKDDDAPPPTTISEERP